MAEAGKLVVDALYQACIDLVYVDDTNAKCKILAFNAYKNLQH